MIREKDKIEALTPVAHAIPLWKHLITFYNSALYRETIRESKI